MEKNLNSNKANTTNENTIIKQGRLFNGEEIPYADLDKEFHEEIPKVKAPTSNKNSIKE